MRLVLLLLRIFLKLKKDKNTLAHIVNKNSDGEPILTRSIQEDLILTAESGSFSKKLVQS